MDGGAAAPGRPGDHATNREAVLIKLARRRDTGSWDRAASNRGEESAGHHQQAKPQWVAEPGLATMNTPPARPDASMNSAPRISRYPVPDIASLPGDLRDGF